jgi:ficolin
MTWFDLADNTPDSAVTKLTGTFIESSITITAVIPSIGPFTCRTYFEGPKFTPPDHIVIATDAPLYTYNWNTTLLSVQDNRVLDCHSLLQQDPNLPSGVYDITLPFPTRVIQAYCDMDTAGGGWTVFQRRMDGSNTFYRLWQEYVNGFGVLTGEFWLGNDNIAAITGDDQYVLRVDMRDWVGAVSYAEYDDFTISPASDNYRLSSVGNFSGPAGDSLEYHRGKQFTTPDQDNDDWLDGSCSDEYRGGWWYGSCFAANLNGEYNGTDGQAIRWTSWDDTDYSLRFTEMKIRPVTF